MRRRQFLSQSGTASLALAFPACFTSRRLAAQLPSAITDFTALELSEAIRTAEVSCREVMQAYLDRMDRFNPVYNAIVSRVEPDLLLAEADAADRELAAGDYRGWMHGMPHAMKDLTEVAGLVYTSGSPLYSERVGKTDSSNSARIRAAGAIFVGKTNTPEFGLGSQSYNPVFGATGCAYNPELTAGGSSGGAACALGTRMMPTADGSDMMGSLRNPGAFNNVIGFRPSAGFMSTEVEESRPLSTSGPMGRNTADAIQLLNTMAPRPLSGAFNPLDLQGLNIAWLGDLDGYLAMEQGILPLCEGSLATVESAGATVEATLPQFNLNDLWFCWTTLRHNGRDGYLDEYNDPELRLLLKPELIYEIEQLLSFTDADIQRAEAIREQWYLEVVRLFSRFDFLAIPTAQVFPFAKQVHWPRYIGDRQMDTYHRWMEVVIPASVAGLPTINVPVGFDASGRPMGMQIIGRYGDDRRVLEFGLAYEQITDYLNRRPELQAA